MKSKTKVRLAAGLTAGAMMLSLSGPAFAQPTQINTGNLVSALNNVNVEIDQLNVLNVVQVVNVEDSVNNNRILNNNDTDITILQDFLNDSLNDNNVQIIEDVLILNGNTLDDVVAIDVLRNSDVLVFVDVLFAGDRSFSSCIYRFLSVGRSRKVGAWVVRGAGRCFIDVKAAEER